MDQTKRNLPVSVDGQLNSLNQQETKKNYQAPIENINEVEELYDPGANRPTKHQISDCGALMHILKGSIGNGIMAMPNAFKNSGLLVGTIGTVLTGILCTYCVHMMVRASQEMSRKAKVPYLGFSQTAEYVFGHGPMGLRKFSKTVGFPLNYTFIINALGLKTVSLNRVMYFFYSFSVDMSICVVFLFGGSMYIIFAAESLMQVVESRANLGWNIYIYISITLPAYILIMQIRELKYLVPLSTLANAMMFIILGICLYYMFSGISEIDINDRDLAVDISHFPLFFSTVIYAIEAVLVVLPVENRMKNPNHFLGCPSVFNVGMALVVFLFGFIGFFGYLKYGRDTKAVMIYNLPEDDVLTDVAKVLMALAVFLTYPLIAYVVVEIFWRRVFVNRIPRKWHSFSQIGIRTFLVTWNAGVAAALPNLEIIISLMGSIFFSTFSIFIPATLQTVLFWDGRLGVFKWRLFKNIFLCCISIFALISGSYFALSKSSS